MLTSNDLCQMFSLEESLMPLCDEIRINFVNFTQRHIARVNTLASFIGKYYPDHDKDKFDLPWYYLLQWRETGHNLDILPSLSKDDIEILIGKDTWKHVLRNPHHPEHWDKSLDPDEPFDRDNVKTNIDATAMTDDALDEFVCDCMSMSIMLDHNPDKVFDWFNKSVGIAPGKRWIMTPSQILSINRRATDIIKILRDPKRKVVFDVDGVLRDIVKYFGTSDNDWGDTVNGNTVYEMITADFSCLKKMPDTELVPVVRAFTQEPLIYSTQIEPPAQKYTTEWLKERFHNPQITYVGKDSSKEKDAMLDVNDRIFDDHPRFPESHKLIIVGHGYNKNKPGFRVNTPAELEGALDVLQKWSED